MKRSNENANIYKTAKNKRRGPSPLAAVFKRYARNKAALLGLALFLILLFMIIFADLIVPASAITAYDTHAKFVRPCAEHLFGTDNLGRDVFARIVHGSRITVGIGVGATLASLALGAIIASFCAVSKKADFIIMRIVDVCTCIPSILLALVLLAILGGSVANMMITLTLVSVPGFVMTIRAVLIAVVEEDYVKASRLNGTGTGKLVLRHILPNALDPIIVYSTMTISSMVLSAAGLSFIGMGVSPPSPEWGAMLNFAQSYYKTAPYLAIIPGIAIALTALSINLIGDGLRDALDPKAVR
ncbi:MAG: ABC transporter permease [Clostridia bacterium]|nr:ABC transporter permease [Clostridia bacterium]